MRHRSSHGRTDPALWEKCKREAVRRLHGRHSARAMQLAGRLYRERGGGYVGPKTDAQRRLTKWTREDWTTADGKPARRRVGGKWVYDRYLPRAAWGKLSAAEKRATRQKKRAAGRGVQYVRNTRSAARAGARVRNRFQQKGQ